MRSFFAQFRHKNSEAPPGSFWGIKFLSKNQNKTEEEDQIGYLLQLRKPHHRRNEKKTVKTKDICTCVAVFSAEVLSEQGCENSSPLFPKNVDDICLIKFQTASTADILKKFFSNYQERFFYYKTLFSCFVTDVLA